MTLKSAAACVKATSRSSTARPQEKAKIRLAQRGSSCPALCRASTSSLPRHIKTWMAGTSSAKTRFALLPGHDDEMGKTSMPAMGFLHRGELLGTGRALVSRLPGLVGHAVDGLAAVVLAHRRALGVRLFLEPVGQAVAAEAREIHQVDILDIGAGAQMFDKAPENGGFEFCSGFVVNRHVRDLAVLRKLIGIRWELSQILPYRSANSAIKDGISAAHWLKRPL